VRLLTPAGGIVLAEVTAEDSLIGMPVLLVEGDPIGALVAAREGLQVVEATPAELHELRRGGYELQHAEIPVSQDTDIPASQDGSKRP